jgi:hypothetical protein
MRSERVLKSAGKWMEAEYSRVAPPHIRHLVTEEVVVKHFSALPVVFDGH